MTVIARKFSACPVRTATETWNKIVDVIANGDESAKSELRSISGIAAAIISGETLRTNPIVVLGNGPRLRVYCIYDEDGSTEDASESILSWSPFEGEWEIHLPVENEDMAWIKNALTGKSSKFKIYQAGEEINEETTKNNNMSLGINIEKLKSYE